MERLPTQFMLPLAQSCFWSILMIYQITWPTASSDCLRATSIIYKPVRSQWLKNSRLILMRQQYGKGIVISAKYLGNTLQSNIKVDKHINDITSNENKALGFLKRKPEHQMLGITSTCPTKAWVLLYSLGPSHSRFYIQNWDGPKAKYSVCFIRIMFYKIVHQLVAIYTIRHNPYTSWHKNQENLPTNSLQKTYTKKCTCIPSFHIVT